MLNLASMSPIVLRMVAGVPAKREKAGLAPAMAATGPVKLYPVPSKIMEWLLRERRSPAPTITVPEVS